ncbi:hypothetical protein RJ639_010744 [Escallonia herrerae]|uniref:Mannan endo-1,4-beta-mannosidase n=1 Tax=Escallonia herrerae TaxID=1293975 RepID=A0AA89ANP2_9ASTE|nr:hypothetical protein RJ639_010744 [Escallonia herrerae]
MKKKSLSTADMLLMSNIKAENAWQYSWTEPVCLHSNNAFLALNAVFSGINWLFSSRLSISHVFMTQDPSSIFAYFFHHHNLASPTKYMVAIDTFIASESTLMARKYAKSPSLYAVELLNEPRSPGATLESVTKYYRQGYNAVRKHSSTAYVVMSNRLGLGPMDSKELFPLASGLQGTIIDVHYYNLFWPEVFDSMTVQQNIDFINTNRSAELNDVTTANGPLTFVGEWVAEWQVKDATKEDYQRFAAAQLKLWGRATFGWAYWTLRNVNNHWSLEWMIKNGYISL